MRLTTEDSDAMNRDYYFSPSATQVPVLQTNKLIRNTYLLLSATLLFSAFTAGAAMFLGFRGMHPLLTLGGYFLFLMLASSHRNSGWGLFWVFALTGFMGLTLGPILNFYQHYVGNGPTLVVMAMGGTAAIFLGLSGYALASRKDFSFLGGFLMTGILVAFLASLASFFLPVPGLSLAVSSMFILLMSGLILYQTSKMVHGSETNYVMATVTLYVAIYNLFLSLLHLLGISSSSD